MNYRDLANTHLKSAENELGLNSDLRLKYAALELRMAMEALTYDRALSYKNEFPPDEYKTWQPRKVMAILLEIDPTADKDYTIAYGTEDVYGVASPNMKYLGAEKVLSMKVLKEHYDAIGNYLHLPSLKQVQDGVNIDFDKLRARCEEVAAFISQALSSSVYNVTLGCFSTLQCMKCESTIRKRIPVGRSEVLAKCHQCKATYTITDEGNGQVKWTPDQQEVECANPNCHEKLIVWQHELEVGKHWKCSNCNGENTIVLTVSYKNTAKDNIQ